MDQPKNKPPTLLGLSQSAVSRYSNSGSGNNLVAIENTTEVQSLIDEMVISLVKEPTRKHESIGAFLQNLHNHPRKRLNVQPLPQRHGQRMG